MKGGFKMQQKFYVYDGSFVSLVSFESLPKEVQKFFKDYQGNVVVIEGVENKKHYFGIFLLFPDGLLEFLEGSKKGLDYIVKFYFTQEAYNIKPKNWIF
jgi:hypothetical protein